MPTKQTTIRLVKLDQIKSWTRNPRLNDEAIPDVMASIVEHGYRDFMEVDEDLSLLAGHTRLKALQYLQRAGRLKTIANVTADEKLPVLVHQGIRMKDAYRIANNKTGERAEWDLPELMEIMHEMEDVQGLDNWDIVQATGFSQEEMKFIEKSISVTEPPYKSEGYKDATFKAQHGFANSSVWADLVNEQAKIWPHLIHPPTQIEKHACRYNYSRANAHAIERIIQLWMDPGDMYYEPCVGWATFSASARFFGYSGVLLDNWDVSLQFCRRQMKHVPGIGTYSVDKGDAMDPPYPDEHFDFIHLNPPFGNMEKYGGQSAGYGPYTKWTDNMHQMMSQNYRVLKPMSYCVVVLADWREHGQLRMAHSDMINIAQDCGFRLHDLVICKLNSMAMLFSQHTFKKRHTVKSHEYILVFEKAQHGTAKTQMDA